MPHKKSKLEGLSEREEKIIVKFSRKFIKTKNSCTIIGNQNLLFLCSGKLKLMALNYNVAF